MSVGKVQLTNTNNIYNMYIKSKKLRYHCYKTHVFLFFLDLLEKKRKKYSADKLKKIKQSKEFLIFSLLQGVYNSDDILYFYLLRKIFIIFPWSLKTNLRGDSSIQKCYNLNINIYNDTCYSKSYLLHSHSV